MRPLQLFIALLLLVVPFVARAQVDHSPKWANGYTMLTYGLNDLDNFAPLSYGYCKWGNIQDRGGPRYYFTKLTQATYNNTNSDIFLSDDSDTSIRKYSFATDTYWYSNAIDTYAGYRLYRYLHFKNELVDAATGAPLTGNETKLIILFHGWNPDSNSDAYSGSEFSNLVTNLKLFTSGTDWKIVKYRWEADSDTGPVDLTAAVNGTEAAEIGHQHGQHLGQVLSTSYPNLQKVHLIAHSAGAWVARGTLRQLQQNNPNVAVQMTLLDPFMPNAIFPINSSLGDSAMNTIFTAPRPTFLGPLENYYSVDTFVLGTQETFSWANMNRDRNIRIDWAANGYTYYQSHAGPIGFYSDTIAHFYSPSLSIPALDNFDLRSDPYVVGQIGWNNSLFLTEPIFTSQPQSQTINHDSTLTLTANATNRKNLFRSGSSSVSFTWLWFKNNQYLTSTSTPSLVIPNAQASDSGKYHAAIYDAAYPANRTTTQYADVTVTQATQTITFADLPSKTYGDAPFTLSATASSGLAPTFSISSGPATISGSTVTITGAGIVVVVASQPGNINYTAATSVFKGFSVAKANQAITFDALSSKTYGDAPFTVGATASSGLVPTFSIFSGPATIIGNTITLTGVGTVVVRASQAGNANYNLATVDQNFTVAKATATVTLGSLSQSYTGTARPATATTTPAGLAVTFTYDGSATAPINGGNYAVVGTISSSSFYRGSASGTLVISPTTQTITFTAPTNKTYSATPFAVSATASSKLAPTFSIVSGPATISGNMITLTGGGTVTVRASQNGNANFAAATPVDRSFTVTKIAQTITFAPPTTKAMNAPILTLTATASSKLPVAFSVISGPATLGNDGKTLTLTGAGSVVVQATQAGNDAYLAAPALLKTIKVTQVAQTITFKPVTTALMTTSTLTLAATSTSGLPVSFVVVSGPATLGIDGKTLTLTGAGSVIVKATQAGNAIYLAAPAVSATIKVSKVTQTITFTPPTTVALNVSPLTLTATASSGLAVTYVVTGPATLAGQNLIITGVGTVTVKASQAGNTVYNAAVTLTKTIKVTAAVVVKSVVSKSIAAPVSISLDGNHTAVLVGADTSSSSGLPIGGVDLRVDTATKTYTALLSLVNEAEPLFISGTVEAGGTADNPVFTAYWPEPGDTSAYTVEFSLSDGGFIVTVSQAGEVIAKTTGAP